MAMRMCLNCIYLCWDPRRWLRSLAAGEPLVPMCANHPQWPGQLREVPGTACRNYSPKPPEPGEWDDTIRRIPLSNGQFAIVDVADYEWLSQYNWHLCSGGYASRYEKGKTILMHRQIMQPPPGMFVDHINHIRGDNRRSNLRVCTCAENQRNRRRQICSRSRLKGVYYAKHGKRCFAKVMFEWQQVWLGCFDDEVEAAHVYDYAAVQYFGPFADLNFPEEWPAERRQKVYADGQPLREALRAKAAKAKAEKGKSRKVKVKEGKGKKAKGKSVTRHTRMSARKGRKRLTHEAKRTKRRAKARTTQSRKKMLRGPRPERPR